MKTCSVDFETGGLQPYFHPALTVAIVPLKADFTPDEDATPFLSKIRPDDMDRVDPGALKVNGLTMEEIADFPPRKETVKAFFEWAAEFGKFSPLAQNWAFDKGFFMAWLDPGNVAPNVSSKYLDYRARDLQRVVMYANDRAEAKGQPFPFNSTSLNKIPGILGITNPAPHTAYGDAVTTALCYSKLVGM